MRFGVEVRQVVGRPFVELGIEHPDDLGRLVVDDGLLLAVPQGRHRDAARVVRIGGNIDIMQFQLAVRAGLKLINALRVGPAGDARQVRQCHRDDVFEALQVADDLGAMRPRAGRREKQVIAARFGLETGRTIGR